jgi:hypothetical protein
MFNCLVLIAGFCFSGADVTVHMHDFQMGYSGEVAAPGYKAQFGATDVPHLFDYRKAPKACIDGLCVRYLKVCDDQPGGAVVCSYWMAYAGWSGDGAVLVTADNRAALADAERDIQKTRVLDGGKGVLIPLSALTVLSKEADRNDCKEMQPDVCIPQ